MQPVSARMDDDLIERIDKVRFEIGAETGEAPSRAEFIRQAAEDRIDKLSSETAKDVGQRGDS